jgi:hypothetical protein
VRRLPVLLAALLLVVAGGAVALLVRGSGGDRASACPKGTAPLAGEQLRELRERVGRPEGERRQRGPLLCKREGVRLPESFGELSRMTTSTAARLGADRPGALAAAVDAKESLAGASIPGTAGAWTPVGKGPLRADDPAYPSGTIFGNAKIAGRVTDFAYDPKGRQLFAAVANGGVWRSPDLAQSWASIGESLRTQTIGAVAWTPAGGGTLIALSGDNATGAFTYSGLGAFWTTDDGHTWNRATGIPNGAMGFRLAVAAGDPNVVYAATGFGLYRSSDAGRSFVNVELPTGRCAGDSTRPACFLANVVTDVVVQSADRYGHSGGAVLAAVGWRSGAQKNADGTVQAPANGLYSSSTGAPGTFTRLAPPGFTPQDRIGRVSLGIADGPAQDHAYLYAVVQDALLFRTGNIEGLDVAPVPSLFDPNKTLTDTPTYLNGVYVSPDFGRSWRLMSTGEQFLLPTSGSGLAATVALGFGPGIQAWFNSVITPDPTTQAGGVPTRVVMGLEEIFESATVGAPQAGLTSFVAVGPYAAGGPLCILGAATDLCAARQQARPEDRTTHPDQHAQLFIPGPQGTTLVVGNDGGVYTQQVPRSGLLRPAGFGAGANEGFNTLVPYGVARAKDGTTYAGLQDNGQMKITPDGRQVATFGGDGTFTLVDPDDANLVLESTPSAGLNRSRDGAHKWDDVSPPGIRDAPFLTPMVMDPSDKKRLGIAGRNVFVTDVGLAGLSADSWTEVYDLGTRGHPGQRDAVANKLTDPGNVASAMAIRGKIAYVGYCGSCDPVKDNTRFGSGVATNVGGEWRIAGARGLPKRIINSMLIDPADARTVYVALGSSTIRPYAAPRALGDDGVDPAGGYVYKSTDGGETFTDITGNLPKIGATWLLARGGQLLAATTVGVFASRTLEGREWGLLGTDLPSAPVFSMTLDPADNGNLVVASQGRGIWSYRFADPCQDRVRPRSRINARSARAARAGRVLRLRGTASDRGCGGRVAGRVKRVSVSVARVTGKRCRYLQRNGRLTRRALSCRRPRYIRARGTRSWRFASRRALPAGPYVIRVRATDAVGNVERSGRANRVRVRLR